MLDLNLEDMDFIAGGFDYGDSTECWPTEPPTEWPPEWPGDVPVEWPGDIPGDWPQDNYFPPEPDDIGAILDEAIRQQEAGLR